MYDLLIEGTRVVDGSGAPARMANAAVELSHRISERGDLTLEQAVQAITSRVDTRALGLHGVWVNGTQVVDERGPIADAGRPGRLMREFDA